MQMMTTFIRRLHNLPVLCVLVISLLTSPVSALGYVWCFNADGYAALEAAMAGDCSTETPSLGLDGIATPSLTAGEDDCGPCLDVSPSHQYSTPNGRDDETLLLSLADSAPAVVAVNLPLPERSLNKKLFTDPPPRTPDLILHHRTTVLLI